MFCKCIFMLFNCFSYH